MKPIKFFVAGFLTYCGLFSSLTNATASFENGTLSMPYVVVGNDLFSVNLAYVANSDPVEFSLSYYSAHASGTDTPENSVQFANNALVIPSLQVGSVYYQLQLDYIDTEGVFRLIETPTLLSSTSEPSLSFKIEAWADNWFAAYLGDDLIVEDSVSITTERSFNAETATFEGSYPLFLNFILKDFKENDTGLEYINANNQQMGDGGFIMQIIEVSSGDVVAVSNEDWKCTVLHEAPLNKSCENELSPVAGNAPCTFTSVDEPADWKDSNFDDSGWDNAIVYSENDVGPKDGYNEINWNGGAELIWGPDLETTNTLICRVTVAAP